MPQKQDGNQGATTSVILSKCARRASRRGGTDWPRKGMPMIEFVRNQSTFIIEDDGLFRERLREFGTKRAFCLAANISADTLNKILNDKGVNYDTAVKVAEALGLYWEDLFYPDTYQTKVVKTKGRGQIASS